MATVPLSDVNPHLICVLCGGYYIDATTISECMHSFCKSCVVKHLETSKFCPICDVQLHKSRPLLSIRPDPALQRLAFKVVPKLYQNELLRRHRFSLNMHQRHDWGITEDNVVAYHQLHSPDVNIQASVEYYSSAKLIGFTTGEYDEENAEPVPKRYLDLPGDTPVRCIKKLLGAKFDNTDPKKVAIYFKSKILPETLTMVEVASIFHWDRINPLELGYQFLNCHIVKLNSSPFLVAVTSSSPSLEKMAIQSTVSRDSKEVKRKKKSSQIKGSYKRFRENSTINLTEESLPPLKKVCSESVAESGREKHEEEERTDNYEKDESSQEGNKKSKFLFSRVREIIDSVTVDDSTDNSEFSVENDIGEEGQVVSPGGTEESTPEVIADEEVMEEENVSQTAESIEEEILGDANQDIEEVVVDIEGEPSQDFILQEDQPMDINEDLEEDDDEDRLRICDPEEISEERIGDENVEEQLETNSGLLEVEEEKTTTHVEEEAEVIRKEGKSRKRTKKAKHHHRHKRDYSPTPEATIVSGDKNDCMKLKLKLKTKQDDSSKHQKLNEGHSSPRQMKNANYVVAEDTYNTSIQSPLNSNIDEDSRNSQSTDDHDARSISSSKEGQDETHCVKGSPLHNGSGDSRAKNRDTSNKEKLMQMRQVRHKNITPPPPRQPLNATINKVSAEEANKNMQKSPILLTSLSLSVSKVTAEEKMKMMTNNNLESKRPSLEILLVNNPNASDSKILENQVKQNGLLPVVKLTKNNSLNTLMQKQNSLSKSKLKSTSEGTSKLTESMKKDEKVSTRPSGKKESCGVLDLPGQVNHSDSSPHSDGSNYPSPNQTGPSMTQPLHPSGPMNSPHQSSSISPQMSALIPKGSPNLLNQHSASLWNLMTLTETAVRVQLNAAQAREALKQQMANNQKKPSPQRCSAVSSPPKSPSQRASPTQLKIPTPNVGIANKFINRPNLPMSNQLPNRERPIGVNKPMIGLPHSIPSASPARLTPNFPSMLQSHSAAVAKKQAGINGRRHHPNIPPPPPAIPISTLYKMESMAKKYDLEKIARSLSLQKKQQLLELRLNSSK